MKKGPRGKTGRNVGTQLTEKRLRPMKEGIEDVRREGYRSEINGEAP
jgi:hypothetical protein